MKWLVGLVLFGVCLYVVAVLILYVFQREVLYYKSEEVDHPFKEIELSNEGETISIVVLNEGKEGAVIYFGGNGEAVAIGSESIASTFKDFTVYLVNYRGFGASTGSPTESAFYSDALKLYEMIEPQHSRISVVGRSLGSGVAAYMAANRPVYKTVLITPYDSILNIAKKNYSLFPVHFLLKDTFDSAAKAKNIKSDVLVIVADNDLVIPMENTQRLIDELDEYQVELKVIKNSDHINLSEDDDYYPKILNFLSS